MSLDVVELTQTSAPDATQAPAPADNHRGWLTQFAAGAARDHVAMLAIIVIWALYVLPARGGWEANVVPAACAVAVLCLLALRPWRHCPPWLALLAAAPAAGGIVVAALSPYGDGGPVSVSRWGYFGILLLATAAYARTPHRRAVVVCAVLLAGLHQYVEAWVPWWGGDDGTSRVMTGTLYSANPFGGLMLTFALLAGCVAVLGEGRIRRVAWLVAPLCASGVFLSAARAAVLLLLLGTVALLIVAARAAGAAGAARVLALVALSWVVLFGTTSSLFFEDTRSTLAGVETKDESGQTLSSTSSIRVDFWKAAWGEWLDEPVVGGGVGSYAGDSRERMTPGAQRSPFAHNEALGSVAEGGVLLGLPVLAVLVTAVVSFSRILLRSLRRGRSRTEGLPIAAALAGGALVAHSMLDFALSFPAILGLLALLLGIVVSASSSASDTPPARALFVAAAAALAVCGVYVGLSHDRAGVAGRAGLESVATDGTIAAAPLPGLRDARVTIAHATRLASSAVASDEELRAAERALQPLLRFDRALYRTKVDLLVAQSREREAFELAKWLAVSSRSHAPILVSPLAERLLARGDREQAFDVLAIEAYGRATEGGRMGLQLIAVLDRAYGLAGPVEPGWSCARTALLDAGVVTDEHPLVLLPAAGADEEQCATWSAQASNILGDRT